MDRFIHLEIFIVNNILTNQQLLSVYKFRHKVNALLLYLQIFTIFLCIFF